MELKLIKNSDFIECFYGGLGEKEESMIYKFRTMWSFFYRIQEKYNFESGIYKISLEDLIKYLTWNDYKNNKIISRDSIYIITSLDYFKKNSKTNKFDWILNQENLIFSLGDREFYINDLYNTGKLIKY